MAACWTIHDNFKSAHGYAAPFKQLDGWWAVSQGDGARVGPCKTFCDLLDEMRDRAEQEEAAA